MDVSDRGTNVTGLIIDQFNLGCCGNVAALLHLGNFPADSLMNPIHHCNRVLAGFPQQGAIHTTFSIHTDDVVLKRRIVLGVSDIFNKNCAPIAGGDGDIVDILGAGQRVDGVNQIVGGTHLDVAAGHHEVGLFQGMNNVGRRQMKGLKLDRVDINHHLPELAPKRVGNLNTLKAAHFVSDRVVTDLVQLGFAQTFPMNGGKHHGQVCRFAAKGERIFNAWRQVKHVTGFKIDDIVHGRRWIGPRLEENLDQARPGHGARFLMFHSTGKSQGPLNTGGNGFFHFPGGQTGIRKVADHNGRSKIRQDVRGNAGHHRQPQKAKAYCRGPHGIGIFKRETK